MAIAALAANPRVGGGLGVDQPEGLGRAGSGRFEEGACRRLQVPLEVEPGCTEEP